MLKYWTIFLFLLIPVIGLAQDDISVNMSVSRDMIGLDEETLITISVSGSTQNLPQPQLPNMSTFDVKSRGTSTNYTIMNGRMESTVEYNYVLFPKRAGTFVIKPAVVVKDQKRYTSNDVTITVVSSSTAPAQNNNPNSGSENNSSSSNSPEIFLRAVVDKTSAYVNEQITLTVKFYHAVRLYSSPDYTAPQTTDFWTTMLKSQQTYTEMVNNRRYNVIEIQTALFPTRSGELEIGSAMVTASVPASSQKRRRDPFNSIFDGFLNRGENKTVRSRPIKVNVKPLPTEGKPDGFTGTVGSFNISQSVDKRTVDVNQPVTVTYQIRGTGNIKTVAEPTIEDDMNFRIYNANSSENVTELRGQIGGTKIFEEVFIPKKAGKLTIPGIDFNFFDPGKKKYRTVKTDPINLTVNQAEGEAMADISYPGVQGRVIDSKLKDVLYIKTSSDDLSRKGELILFNPLYIVINVIPLLVLAGVIINRKRQEKLTGDIGYARSRAAKKMAKKRLSRAGKLAGENKPAEFYSEIRTALFSYVADKLNISPHGLTGDKLVDILNQSGTDQEFIENIKTLLKKADFAQYAPSTITTENISDSLALAEKVLVGMEEAKLG